MKSFLKVYKAKIPARYFRPNSAQLKILERELLNLNTHLNRIALTRIYLDHPKIKYTYNVLLGCDPNEI